MTRIRTREALLSGVDDATRARRALCLDMFEAALEAVDPVVCTRRALRELQSTGALGGSVTLFAFGKAARGMVEAALAEVEVKRGISIGFEAGQLEAVRLLQGGHPVPSDAAPVHAQAMLELARELTVQDTALVLVSGGGSALLELPAAGLTLRDLQTTTQVLLASGAEIQEVNAVRSALSQVKGGRLARAMAQARVVNVLLSDVIASPLPTIASGPSVDPDPDLPSALEVIHRYDLQAQLPKAVLDAVRRHVPITSSGANITSVIAADNLTAQSVMLETARLHGMSARRREAYLRGEAKECGSALLREACALGVEVYVAGGETTVTLGEQRGHGGRNQELVLGSIDLQARLIAALGTDGIDGDSDAAGALLDPLLRARVRALGPDPHEALLRHDSNSPLARAGATLVTGKTGTNVADVCVVMP